MKRDRISRIAKIGALTIGAALSLTATPEKENKYRDTIETIVANDTINANDSIKAIRPIGSYHPDARISMVYDIATLDSLANRKLSDNEKIVDSILDTLDIESEVIDKYMFKGLLKQESGYNPEVQSHVGARGVAQTMRSTYKRFGRGPFSNADMPQYSMEAGLNYLLWLEQWIQEKNPYWEKADLAQKRNWVLAAYNGGHGRLQNRNWEISRMPKETKDYLAIVDDNRIELVLEQGYKQWYAELVQKNQILYYWNALMPENPSNL